MSTSDYYTDIAMHFAERAKPPGSVERSLITLGYSRPSTIIPGDDGSLYLWRIYLTPHHPDPHGVPVQPRNRPALFLHYFFRGDLDRELHSHPWKWGLSFILTNGYTEERYEDPYAGLFDVDCEPKRVWLKTRRHRALSWNLIRGHTYHRVLLDRGNVWSLFVAGPKKGGVRGEDWGFLDTDTGAYTSWGARERQRHTAALRKTCPQPGEKK